MKILYISHNLFGLNCLHEILDNGGDVIAIWTIDQSLSSNISDYVEFDDVAKEYHIPLHKCRKIDEAAIAQIKELNPDIIFVFGWSQLLPNELLDLPAKGCIGMHPTLLPKGRGRAAIPWALIKGHTKTGLTMFYLSEGADTGDIIGQKEIIIDFEDNARTLYSKVILAGGVLISEYLPQLENDSAPRIKQDDQDATIWPKRIPEDGLIDWTKSSLEIYNWIRGLAPPYPGAFTYYLNEKVHIYSAKCVDRISNVEPGTIIEVSEEGLLISAWESAILITSFGSMDKIQVGEKFQKKSTINKKVICNIDTDLIDNFCESCHHSKPHDYTKGCENECTFHPDCICIEVV